MIRSDHDDLVLKGVDAKGASHAYTHGERVAATWAYAHDLAAEQHGEELMPGFFTSSRGNALMAQLEASPDTATCEEMIELVKEHLQPPPKADHAV